LREKKNKKVSINNKRIEKGALNSINEKEKRIILFI
jgi:hypothetical protein